MSEPAARTSDLIRKACAGFLAVAVTVLLFRAMFRLANGHGSWLDLELWIALLLATVGIVWVRAARRVR